MQKKNSPAAGPLPGVALSGEQPPAARCAGAQGAKKRGYHTFVQKSRFSFCLFLRSHSLYIFLFFFFSRSICIYFPFLFFFVRAHYVYISFFFFYTLTHYILARSLTICVSVVFPNVTILVFFISFRFFSFRVVVRYCSLFVIVRCCM